MSDLMRGVNAPVAPLHICSMFTSLDEKLEQEMEILNPYFKQKKRRKCYFTTYC